MPAQKQFIKINVKGTFAPEKLTKIFQPAFVRALKSAIKKGGKPPVASPKGCGGLCPQKMGGRVLKHCKLTIYRDGSFTITCEY